MTSTAPACVPRVTIGVDTHKHFHVAHAADELGRPLGDYTMPTTGTGYGDFVAWARSLGELEVVGIEGVGHYGAGLGRALRAAGVRVTEVGRPNRQRRARHGKTDSVDAAGAAAIVLAAKTSATQSLPTGTPRCCVSCGWLVSAPSGPARRRSMPSRT